MSEFFNSLEFQDPKIATELDEALKRNVEKGLGKAGLGSVLGQEVANAKESGDIEEKELEKDEIIKTRERYAGINIGKEVEALNIDSDLPDEEKRIKIAKALNCMPYQISFNQDEALSGNDIVYYYGDLDLDYLESAENLVLPLSVDGDIWLDGLKSVKNLVLPQSVVDNISLDGLKSADNLVLPQSVGQYIWLQGLKSIKGLDLSNVDSHIYLSKDMYNRYKDKLEKIYPNLAGKFLSGKKS